MGFITYELADHVVTLTITREDALNALNTQVLTELDAALDQAWDDKARALVITGAGRAFVAGADIATMRTMNSTAALVFSQHGNSVMRHLEKLPIPSIAAVNGFALGGGCELALACDIRLAADTAVFAQPEVGLGIPPGFGGTQRLARLVGTGIAKQLIYTGQRVTAQRALEIGLVNSVHPAKELLPAALSLAAEIARQAPLAVRAAKTSLTRGIHTDLDTAGAIEAAQFAACFETDDQREAMAAFVEKRTAAPFVGR